MAEIPQFPEALNNFPELNLDLPDPEDEEIPDSEFENVVQTSVAITNTFTCIKLVAVCIMQTYKCTLL